MIKNKINQFLCKNKKLDFLIKSQYWNSYKLESYQNKKLVKLINYAYDNVDYYKKLFLESGIHPKI